MLLEKKNTKDNFAHVQKICSGSQKTNCNMQNMWADNYKQRRDEHCLTFGKSNRGLFRLRTCFKWFSPSESCASELISCQLINAGIFL